MSIWHNSDTASQSHVIQTWWHLENSRINPTGYMFENMKSAAERLKAQQKIAVISGLNADSVIAGASYTLQSSLSFMLANNTQHTITRMDKPGYMA